MGITRSRPTRLRRLAWGRGPVWACAGEGPFWRGPGPEGVLSTGPLSRAAGWERFGNELGASRRPGRWGLWVTVRTGLS